MPIRYYGVQNEVKAYCNRLQNETSIVVTPSVLKTLNDRVETLKRSGVWSQFGLGFNDNDGDAYLSRASVTNIIGRAEVLWFTRGMKSLGLWSNMVSWPLRSYHNIGSGSTVYSLGGLGNFNGTMVNSPSWSFGGVVFASASTQRITTSLSSPSPITSKSIIAVFNPFTINQWSGVAGFVPQAGIGYTDVSIARNSATSLFGLALAGISGNGAVATQVTPLNTLSYFHGYHTGRNVTVVKDGSTTTTGLYNIDARPATSFGIGLVEGGFPFNGLVSFAALVTDPSAGTRALTINTLFKQTLGNGLRLP